MKYWLYTWEYPEGDIEWNECAIYKVVREFEDEDEGIDMIEIGDVVYDPESRNQWNNGDVSDIYEDSVTEDPKRVIPFLFDRKFW